MHKLVAIFVLVLSPILLAEVQMTPQQQEAANKLSAKGGLVMPLAADADSVVVSLQQAGKQVTDEDLAQLKNLPKISQLNLANTAVTDAGLANIAGLTNLTHLHLEKTAITDAGLANLKNLTNLVYLNLYSTAVTDAGLANLTGLTNLKGLYLWQSKVTPAGKANLKKSLPNCTINLGEELAIIVPKPPEPASASKPINSVCPVSGKPVVLPNTLAYEGKTIGFCCDKCPKEFEKDPKKFAANIKADAAPADKKDDKKADAKPADKKDDKKPDAKPADKKPDDKKPDEPKKLVAINTKCPVSGEDVDAGVVSLFENKGVGFCCEDCQKKFLKEPTKFKDKIVADAKK